MIRLSVQAFSLAKAGNQPEQYEDAWDDNQETKRLAIADGASDAFESRLWACSLVQAFVSQPPAPDATSIEGWLSEPIKAWRAQIQWQKLRWYAAEKARRGAYATLLGVTFNWPADQMTEDVAAVEWQAMAIGDACLFQVREEQVITRFPIEQSAEFGTTPALLSTRPSYNQRSLEKLQLCQGECQLGDLLVLATDALAAWFLKQLEAGKQPWQELIGLTPSEDEFARLIERLRQEKAMRNDDVTLLLAWVEKDKVRE